MTTLRKDIKTDSRHTEIETIDDWKEDSKRRDFTINAIYLNKKGKIFDPQQGINDLKNNIVKFIRDPQTRIEEDFLRIIRFLRFSIQYNSTVETSTIKAIKLNLNGIKSILYNSSFMWPFCQLILCFWWDSPGIIMEVLSKTKPKVYQSIEN